MEVSSVESPNLKTPINLNGSASVRKPNPRFFTKAPKIERGLAALKTITQAQSSVINDLNKVSNDLNSVNSKQSLLEQVYMAKNHTPMKAFKKRKVSRLVRPDYQRLQTSKSGSSLKEYVEQDRFEKTAPSMRLSNLPKRHTKNSSVAHIKLRRNSDSRSHLESRTRS